MRRTAPRAAPRRDALHTPCRRAGRYTAGADAIARRCRPCADRARRACARACVGCWRWPLPAAAQWKWRDKRGQVQYSDLPPPRDIPDTGHAAAARAGRRAGRAAPRPRAGVGGRRRRAAQAQGASTPNSKPTPQEGRSRSRPRKAEGRRAERIAAAQGRQLQPRARASCARSTSGMRMARIKAKASARSSTTSSAPTKRSARATVIASRLHAEPRRGQRVDARSARLPSRLVAQAPRFLRVDLQRPVELDPVAVAQQRRRARCTRPQMPTAQLPPGRARMALAAGRWRAAHRARVAPARQLQRAPRRRSPAPRAVDHLDAQRQRAQRGP